jgi:hypothetical protein
MRKIDLAIDATGPYYLLPTSNPRERYLLPTTKTHIGFELAILSH